MPSQAFKTFRYNVVDADRLIASHSVLKGIGQGKKGLGHITRSAVVMLCASWEMYVEQLLTESVKFLADSCTEPDQLPQQVQKSLSSFVKSSRHELKPLQLSGLGWRSVLKEHAHEKANTLNTPKSNNLNELFLKHVGLSNFSDTWSIEADEIDSFVTVRGDIAHRGRHARYVKIAQLWIYRNQVWSTAVDSDNSMAMHLKVVTPNGKQPWRATS